MAETEDGMRHLLQESITEARRVLTEHHEYLSGNETRTRALVLDTEPVNDNGTLYGIN